MAPQASGILRWSSSIRDSMINDPGRQFFEDQVQSQGFLFLEEYLDNIWAAAKQEKKTCFSSEGPTSGYYPHDRCGFLRRGRHFSIPSFRTTSVSLEGVTKPGDHAIDLPSQISESPLEISKKTEVAPQPFPSVPSGPSTFIDMSVPLKDASANVISRNSSLSQFPSLAAPSPLRKSGWNPRDSSLEPSLATTPGTAPSGGVKRKSSEMEYPVVSLTPEPRLPVPPTLQLQAIDVRTARSADDVSSLQTASETDMMAPLKKAIEVLRARTGKSLAGNLVEMNPQEPSPVDGEAEVPRIVADVPTRSSPLCPSLPAPIHIHGAATTETMIVRIPTPPRSTQQVAEPSSLRLPARKASVSVYSTLFLNTTRATQLIARRPTKFAFLRRLRIPRPPQRNRLSSFLVGHRTAFSVQLKDEYAGPVFNKPPPVFVLPPTTKLEPSPVESGGSIPKVYPSGPPDYSLGAPFGLGFPRNVCVCTLAEMRYSDNDIIFCV
ncbi:hypothetical protein BJV78DRAFT_1291276 [Lactifluus subvellereus]|nr:hypothetical protein BJV78DRAFT_1291276 [Lactifluus subvellereus]